MKIKLDAKHLKCYLSSSPGRDLAILSFSHGSMTLEVCRKQNNRNKERSSYNELTIANGDFREFPSQNILLICYFHLKSVFIIIFCVVILVKHITQVFKDFLILMESLSFHLIELVEN